LLLGRFVEKSVDCANSELVNKQVAMANPEMRAQEFMVNLHPVLAGSLVIRS
jgi:hypothetical protein